MATKIKKLYKKFKFISRIFAVKEKKLEIGYPTDVKHVTHIGPDTPSVAAASSFMTAATDSTESSIHNSRGSNFTLSTWSSQDFEQSMEHDIMHSSDLTKNSKKQKHKRFTSKSSTTTSKTNKVHVHNLAD